jgi:hypothetical protein
MGVSGKWKLQASASLAELCGKGKEGDGVLGDSKGRGLCCYISNQSQPEEKKSALSPKSRAPLLSLPAPGVFAEATISKSNSFQTQLSKTSLTHDYSCV